MNIQEWTLGGGGLLPPPRAYSGMAELLVHQHPALSSTGAKKLTPPSTPAHYRAMRDGDYKPTREMEFGTAAHTVVLGTGQALHVVEASGWNVKAGKEGKQLAYDLGRLPILESEYEKIQAMADAIRQHPVASLLFQRQRYEAGQLIPATGTPELSLFWRDDLSGIDKRCRLDWFPHYRSASGVLIVPDYKTCVSASPDAVSRAFRDYGYPQQAQWNTEGIEALGLNDGAPVLFVFVFQEKTAPYLINTVAVGSQSLQVAERKNYLAARLFRECSESGEWPGYGNRIDYVDLPYWDLKRELEEMQ